MCTLGAAGVETLQQLVEPHVLFKGQGKKINISTLIWPPAVMQQLLSLFYQNCNCSTSMGLDGVRPLRGGKKRRHVGICFTYVALSPHGL